MLCCSFAEWEENFSSSLGHKPPFFFFLCSFVLLALTSIWFLWMVFKGTHLWTIVHFQLDLEEDKNQWSSESKTGWQWGDINISRGKQPIWAFIYVCIFKMQMILVKVWHRVVGNKELIVEVSLDTDTASVGELQLQVSRPQRVSFFIQLVSLLARLFRFLVHKYTACMLSNLAEQLAHQYLHGRPL